MKDYFNLYGDGHEDKLRDLEKKGEKFFEENETAGKELYDDIPLSAPQFEEPDIVINQQAFESSGKSAEQTLSESLPKTDSAAFITADEIKQGTFKSEGKKPEPTIIGIPDEKQTVSQPVAQENTKLEQTPESFVSLPEEEPSEKEPKEQFDDSQVNMRVVKKAQKKAIKKARRKKNRIKNLIWLLLVLMISVALSWLAIQIGRDVLGISVSEERKAHSFSIAQGASSSEIIDTLKENDIVDFPLVFKLYCKLKHADGSFKFGRYTMYETYNYDTVIAMLQSEGAQRATVSITVPECATIDDICDLLVQNKVCTAEQFESVMNSHDFDADFPFVRDIPDTVYRRFEGYLYPDTYEVFCSDENYNIYDYGYSNAKSAVEKMLQAFSDSLPDDYMTKVKALSKYGINSLNDVVALASIVDLECNGEYDQMASVASVFMNRLVWSEPHFLGSTPTYYYPDNRYNTNAGSMTVKDDNGNTKTYKAGFEGLPPGAQCSMVKQAVHAVLNADKKYLGKGYYYFVTDTDKKYYYNQTLAQHNATIDDLISKGKWDA